MDKYLYETLSTASRLAADLHVDFIDETYKDPGLNSYGVKESKAVWDTVWRILMQK